MTVGYDYFKGKYLNDHVSFLPIRAGIQAFPADLIFLFAEAGIANYHDSNNTSETGFSYGLGAGYRITLAKQYVQLSADYNYFRFSEVLNYTSFGFRLAYGLNLPRRK